MLNKNEQEFKAHELLDEELDNVAGGSFEEIDGITWAYCPDCGQLLGKYDLKNSMGQMSFLLTLDKHKKECNSGN